VNKLSKKMYLLMLVAFLCVPTLFLSVEAVEQPPLVYVRRDIKLSSYGYLLLNDTITFINNSTSPLRLPTLTLTYPTTAIDLRAQQPLSEDYVKIERFGNLSSLKLSADITIPALSNLTFTFRAVLGGLLKPVGGSRYELMAPMPSSPDNQIAEAVVTISLPADVSLVSAPEGFKSEGGGGWSTTLKNIQPAAEPRTIKLLVNGSEYSLTVLTVEREERVVKVVSPTEVIVLDTLTLVNEGGGTLSYLKILDKGLSSATLLRGDIPLRDQKTIYIIGGSLDFYSLIKDNLKAGERITFTLSYPLPERAAVADNTIILRVPQKPLVDALVKEYRLTIDVPRGCRVESPSTLHLSYISPISEKQIDVSVRFGVAWASAYAFPVATLLFLASFIALSAYVTYRREAKEQPLLELIKLYEDALSSQEAIAEELLSERLDRLQIQRIEQLTQRIKDIRTKTSQRVSQIRSRLTLDQKSEKMLAELTSLDKAYERTLTDLLAAYRGYLSGKLKREAFQKAASEKTSSLRKLASSIRDLLDEISQTSALG
jgi:hypothetical protein